MQNAYKISVISVKLFDEKSVDKRHKLWYNNKAVGGERINEVKRKGREETVSEREFHGLRTYSQFIYLTKIQKCDIMNELSFKRETSQRRMNDDDRKQLRYLEN